MANINAAVNALLTSDATFNSINKGVSPEKISQLGTTYPRTTYKRLDKLPEYVLSGASTGTPTAHFEIVVYSYSAAGFADLQTAIDALRNVLSPANGWQRQSLAGVWVQAVFLESEVDSFNEPAHADDVGIYETTFSVRITYNE